MCKLTKWETASFAGTADNEYVRCNCRIFYFRTVTRNLFWKWWPQNFFYSIDEMPFIYLQSRNTMEVTWTPPPSSASPSPPLASSPSSTKTWSTMPARTWTPRLLRPTPQTAETRARPRASNGVRRWRMTQAIWSKTSGESAPNQRLVSMKMTRKRSNLRQKD